MPRVIPAASAAAAAAASGATTSSGVPLALAPRSVAGSVYSLASLAGDAEYEHTGAPVTANSSWLDPELGFSSQPDEADGDDRVTLMGHGHGHGGGEPGGAAPAGMLAFAMQVAPSLLVSGCGMLGAGALLDVVQVRQRGRGGESRKAVAVANASAASASAAPAVPVPVGGEGRGVVWL